MAALKATLGVPLSYGIHLMVRVPPQQMEGAAHLKPRNPTSPDRPKRKISTKR